jgi:predicted phosphodiesterase
MRKDRTREVKRLLVVLIVWILCFCWGATWSQAAEFKFVVWGDSQFQNPDTFERIVEETALLKPALVIHVGDMIHGYTYNPDTARREWKRFKKQIAPLSAPFYPTPGNHDVTTTAIEPVYAEVWGGDHYYYSFDYANSHFIVLDTFLNMDEEADKIPQRELEWLQNDLEKHKDAENIFISFHSPLYLNEKYDWQPIHNLLVQYPVRAIFTGHYHIYDYRVKDTISYFCINSSGYMNYYNHLIGQSYHFVVVSVDGSEITYAVVTDGRIYPADAVPPGESSKASKYLEEEKTIAIPDPSRKKIREKAYVPVRNRTDEERQFLLTWETEDYRWRFKPWGANFTLAPGEEKRVEFRISGPRGNFVRSELPRLRIDSPFTNGAGWKTTLTYYYHLFHPPETSARRLKGMLEFDGKIDDPVWKGVPEIDRFFLDDKGTPAPETTIVKVLYDQKNLYVGIRGEEPNPGGLSTLAHGKLPLVFSDDDFELYFDTNRDLKTYYRLMVNPAGTVLCSGPGGLFSFTFDVRTHVGENYWSAEFKIPFSELHTSVPKKHAVWGFNVRRHRQQAEPPQRDWSKMLNVPYQPPYFGLLRFN